MKKAEGRTKTAESGAKHHGWTLSGDEMMPNQEAFPALINCHHMTW